MGFDCDGIDCQEDFGPHRTKANLCVRGTLLLNRIFSVEKKGVRPRRMPHHSSDNELRALEQYPAPHGGRLAYQKGAYDAWTSCQRGHTYGLAECSVVVSAFASSAGVRVVAYEYLQLHDLMGSEPWSALWFACPFKSWGTQVRRLIRNANVSVAVVRKGSSNWAMWSPSTRRSSSICIEAVITNWIW